MELYRGIVKGATGMGILFAFSCAKPREAKLALSADSQVFSIQELGGNEIGKSIGTIQLSGDKSEPLFADMALALNDRPSYAISMEESSVPSNMKYMLEGVSATGKPGQNFPITITVDDSNLTVYKMVDKVSDLSVLECGLSLKRAQLDILLGLQFGKAPTNSIQMFRELGNACEKGGEGLIYVPLFKYKIAAKGILERKKNSIGEETAELVIKPTDIKNATHIQVSSGVDARLNAPFMDVTNDESIAHVFVADKVLVDSSALETNKEGPSNNVTLNSKPETAPLTTKFHGVFCNGNLESVNSGKMISIPAKFVNVVMDINQSGKISEVAKLVPASKGVSRMLSLELSAAKEISGSACKESTSIKEVKSLENKR